MCGTEDAVIVDTPKIVCCTHMWCVSIVFQVYTWGCNDEGALGRITNDGEEYSPGLVETIKEQKILQVSAGTVKWNF